MIEKRKSKNHLLQVAVQLIAERWAYNSKTSICWAVEARIVEVRIGGQPGHLALQGEEFCDQEKRLGRVGSLR